MVPLVNFKFWMTASQCMYDIVFNSLLMSSSSIHGCFAMSSGTQFDILLLVISVKSYPNILLCSHPFLSNLVDSTVLGLFYII